MGMFISWKDIIRNFQWKLISYISGSKSSETDQLYIRIKVLGG